MMLEIIPDLGNTVVLVTFEKWRSTEFRVYFERTQLIMWDQSDINRHLRQEIIRQFWSRPIPYIPSNIVLSDN